MGSCAPSGSACAVVVGWTDDVVPACGAPGTLLQDCRSMMGDCTPLTGSRVQACR
ncbi:MAG: hypothetical protein HY905_22040 [Deltaproteobacteria bacterium]|nr:hypothetical protein [Deltaproteobacteria bacterium]